MARSSQTDAAVLGGLSVQPMSGYALREAIRDVLGHFWSESFGQIYPTLTALEREGFVARSEGDRAGSSTFHITPAGRRRLRELLSQPIQGVPPRNGLLLRLFFGRTLGADACRALLRDARADAERKLAEFDRLLAENAAETGPDAPFMRMTILAGRRSAEAGLAWADECLTELEEL
ncbi:PadR family transcriptional regulator [Dactylosporangium sp. AC04546]|uniref:PadR family transcriptional regulator n=1 Tax=Dactylosporangium sp. AC04546 TaxID=2862460 RepID=UPI001EDFBDA0|nr:PadR family transcriptional regulator [Dactylosporangium sp. AC04546]WVK87929.1 PadR family transcriptional regulator [Dactylosporangium sp. AC04546]